MLNKEKKIDLVILAGGKGSRIKKFLKKLPKPMVQFNNKHFLRYLINNVSKYNFNKIFILTGYRSEIIFNKFNNKEFNFIKVKCLKEKKEMGTGGALSILKNKVNDFVLINGDTLFDINYNDLIKSLKKNNIGTIALKKNGKQISSKLNQLILKKNLIEYHKKNKLMNGGVYFFKKKFLNYIPRKKCSLENDVLPKLINKKKITGKIFNNFFLDIGSEKYYKRASKLLIDNFKKKAVFLDRDGVINYDYGYVHTLKKFKFRKGVLKGLRYLTKNNYYIFVITNQAGIGKKKFSLKKFNKLHIQLKKLFIKNEININDVQYSPYHINSKILKFKRLSKFRKPGNLMIKTVLKNWDTDKKKSFMIGDKKTDYLAAKKSNIKFYFPKKDFFKQMKSII